MGYGATTVGFGSEQLPTSTTVDFSNEQIYVTYIDADIAHSNYENIASALPHAFNTALSEIESNWLGGSKALQAWPKAGTQQVSVIFANDRRLIVGSTSLDAQAIDNWIQKSFGVRPTRNPK